MYTLPQAIQHQQWYLHLFSKIFAGFALIALLMAAVGIYAVIFVVVASLLAIVGLLACWIPAHRAAGLDPVKAIRYE